MYKYRISRFYCILVILDELIFCIDFFIRLLPLNPSIFHSSHPSSRILFGMKHQARRCLGVASRKPIISFCHVLACLFYLGAELLR